MKHIFSILQVSTKYILLFVLFFIWLKFSLNSFWLSLVLSALLALIIGLISHKLSQYKSNKLHLKQTQREEAEKMFISLATSQDSLSFLFDLFASRHRTLSLYSNFILVNGEHKTIVYPALKFKPISPDNMFEIARKLPKDTQKLIIICGEFEDSCKKYSNLLPFEVVLLDKYSSYTRLYQEYDFYPEISQSPSINTHNHFREILSFAFNKSRATGYVFAGTVIFLSSFLVKFNLYYQIIASLLYVFAIISLTNNKNNSQTKKELL